MRKFKAAFAVMSVLASGFAASGADSGITVVVSGKPTVSERFAAKELKYHLEKATDREVSVVDENSVPSGGRRFFVGNVKALAAAGVDYAGFGVDERIVKGVGGDIYFAGGEAANFDSGMKRMPLHWRTHYGLAAGGTLYAVYDFLEKEMGVMWIWPGKLGEIIPKRNVPSLDGVERRGVEPLLFRSFGGDPERRMLNRAGFRGWKDATNAVSDLERRRLWLTRNRIGRRRVYRSGHAFEDWYKRFRDHPEYFAKQPGGLRGRFSGSVPDAGHNKYYPLCVSNPDVHDIIVSDWLRNNRAAIKAGKRPLNINCCENDSPGFCTCDGCRAWDADDPRFKTHPYWKGEIKEVKCIDRGIMAREQWGEGGETIEGTEPPSVTDRYIRFYNAVLEKARKVYPQAELFGYSYSNYRKPPRKTRLADGVLISFVPGVIFPYSEAQSAEYRADWSAWCRMGAKLMYYRPNYMHGGGSMPYSQARRMADDINFAYASGSMGAISQDSLLGAWSAQALKNYVAARILREPDARYAKMSAEFFSAFGAAADDVRRYFDMTDALNEVFTADEWSKTGRANRAKNGSPGGRWSNFVLNIADLYSEKWFADADAVLESAAGKVSGTERERVAFLRKGLRDGLLTYRTRVAQKSGDGAAFRKAFMTMVDYRASVEADGVCAWGCFADKEYDHAGWPHRVVKLRTNKTSEKKKGTGQ